jgi:hypothetical protein
MSDHEPIVQFVNDDDERFFRDNPTRRFRTRPYIHGEFGSDEHVGIPATNAVGAIVKADTIIVERLASGLKRRAYADARGIPLDDDDDISDFMRVRGIEPRLRGLKSRKS